MAKLAQFLQYFNMYWSLLKPKCPRISHLKGINILRYNLLGNKLITKVHGQSYKKTAPTMIKLALFLHYLSISRHYLIPDALQWLIRKLLSHRYRSVHTPNISLRSAGDIWMKLFEKH